MNYFKRSLKFALAIFCLGSTGAASESRETTEGQVSHCEAIDLSGDYQTIRRKDYRLHKISMKQTQCQLTVKEEVYAVSPFRGSMRPAGKDLELLSTQDFKFDLSGRTKTNQVFIMQSRLDPDVDVQTMGELRAWLVKDQSGSLRIKLNFEFELPKEVSSPVAVRAEISTVVDLLGFDEYSGGMGTQPMINIDPTLKIRLKLSKDVSYTNIFAVGFVTGANYLLELLDSWNITRSILPALDHLTAVQRDEHSIRKNRLQIK